MKKHFYLFIIATMLFVGFNNNVVDSELGPGSSQVSNADTNSSSVITETLSLRFYYNTLDRPANREALLEGFLYHTEVVPVEQLYQEFIRFMNYYLGLRILDMWFEGDKLYIDLHADALDFFNASGWESALINIYSFKKSLLSLPNISLFEVLIDSELGVTGWHFDFGYVFVVENGEIVDRVIEDNLKREQQILRNSFGVSITKEFIELDNGTLIDTRLIEASQGRVNVISTFDESTLYDLFDLIIRHFYYMELGDIELFRSTLTGQPWYGTDQNVHHPSLIEFMQLMQHTGLFVERIELSNLGMNMRVIVSNDLGEEFHIWPLFHSGFDEDESWGIHNYLNTSDKSFWISISPHLWEFVKPFQQSLKQTDWGDFTLYINGIAFNEMPFLHVFYAVGENNQPTHVNLSHVLSMMELEIEWIAAGAMNELVLEDGRRIGFSTNHPFWHFDLDTGVGDIFSTDNFVYVPFDFFEELGWDVYYTVNTIRYISLPMEISDYGKQVATDFLRSLTTIWVPPIFTEKEWIEETNLIVNNW